MKNNMDEAIEEIQKAIDTQTRYMSDDEYLDFLEEVIALCQTKIDAKRSE